VEKERIGLFGGTFNPIHSGHLRAAEIVKKKFFLEKIFFIPSYIPPHKESAGIASAAHRLRMVELALRPYSSFVPCSIEVEAREKSYSIITVNKLKKLHPQALTFFILGVDAFLEIETWKDYEQLLEQCYFVVIDRPGYRLDDARKTLKGKYLGKMHKLSEPGPVKEELLLSFKIFLLPIDALDIASTEVRKRIKKGESIKDMVSKEVEAYIMNKRLYQT
jgi:nicotinate-nucleotide adenylyltransferase